MRTRLTGLFRLAAAAAAAIALAGLAAGCAGISSASTGRVSVIAAEDFWGSIAGQIAGDKASVQSIITNPAEDPHSYEPTAQDARALAFARLAIVNGAGYDPWAPKLLDANPDPGRIVLNVGNRFGLHEGDNPHRWYDPAEVQAVAAAIADDLAKLDPPDARYFARRLAAFEHAGLARYHTLIAQIRQRYAGTPIGASESIVAPLAPALGLDLVTPATFMKAVSEGTDVSAQDAIATERQITSHEIKLWIYNAQNATPEIQRLNALARANHVPTATITETLSPASATFEQWQVAQLERIEQALHAATGR